MSRIKTWAAVAGAFVLALVAAFWRGRSAGRQGAQNERAKDTLDAIERGRDAVRDGRAGGGTPDERLRQNDGRWM